MKSINGWLGRTLFMAVLFVAVPVWADEPAKPVVVAAKPVAAAEEAYSEGKRLAEANKWLAAVTLFEKAYALDPSPNRAAHLGRAQVMTEAYAAGATNLERYLREEKNPPADRRAAIEELLRGAKEKVATVTLQLDEPGVTVRIGQVDVPTERLSWPQYVAPGTHVFEATKAGFEVSTETREVVAGSAIDVTFKMKVARVVKDEPTQRPAKVNPLWIAGGALSAALVVTGVGLGIGSKMRNDQAVAAISARDKQRYDEEYGASTSLWTGGFVSASVGVALGVTTLIYAIKSHRDAESKRNAAVSLVVVPTVGGVIMQACW